MHRNISTILLGLCLLVPSFPLFALSSPATVLSKLETANHTKHVTVSVVKSYRYDARFLGRRIIITTAMLNLIKNDHELAMILGHELAHAVTSNELQADIIGTTYSKRAGYNPCIGKEVLKRAQKVFGEPPAGDPHPPWATRYNTVSRICR